MAEQPETSSSSSSRQPSSSNSATSTANTQNSPQDATLPKQAQGPTFSGLPPYPGGNLPMFQVIHPLLVPGFSHLQNQEQMVNRGAGIYAVPVPPYTAPFAGLPSNTLIPLTFNIPTGPSPDTATTGEHGQGGQQPQQQQHPHQAVAQRQIVVRRFQIAFQLDLLLILKLAAVVFLFNQDGSRQRLLVLVFFASLVYLYQTGALAPLVRWLSQSMQRAAAPPRPPRPAIRPENLPGAARQNENVPLAGEQVGVENENRPAQDAANQAVENENAAEPGAAHDGGNQWWGIVKEIQMIVFGFITSLLPGFHNVD